MSQQSERNTNDELRAENLKLEEQLAVAGQPAEAQDEVEEAVRETLFYTSNIVDTVREPIVVLDRVLGVRTASRAFYETFGVSKEETEGQFVHNLRDGQWDIRALRALLEEVLRAEMSFQDFEVADDFPKLGRRVMLLNARKVWREGNRSELVLRASYFARVFRKAVGCTPMAHAADSRNWLSPESAHRRSLSTRPLNEATTG